MVIKTILPWLAVLSLASSANAAHYGPYPEETYQTCGASNAPVAVELIHGGAWTRGDISASQVQSPSFANISARTVSMFSRFDYRLTPKRPWPSQLQDAQLGLRYLRLSSIAKRVGVIGTLGRRAYRSVHG